MPALSASAVAASLKSESVTKIPAFPGSPSRSSVPAKFRILTIESKVDVAVGHPLAASLLNFPPLAPEHLAYEPLEFPSIQVAKFGCPFNEVPSLRGFNLRCEPAQAQHRCTADSDHVRVDEPCCGPLEGKWEEESKARIEPDRQHCDHSSRDVVDQSRDCSIEPIRERRHGDIM